MLNELRAFGTWHYLDDTDFFLHSLQQAQTLLSEAQQKNDQATSLFEFTEVINQHFNKAAKYQLIKNIWQVAYADKKIDQHEDHLIRKVADLIYVGNWERFFMSRQGLIRSESVEKKADPIGQKFPDPDPHYFRDLPSALGWMSPTAT